MTGRVTSTPEGIVPLRILNSNGDDANIDAVLDTGFTDCLTLPHALITKLRLAAIDTVECQLADGQIVVMESYSVIVEWHGSNREVLALAADGDPLLGMALLNGSRVTLNVRAGDEITIEPIR